MLKKLSLLFILSFFIIPNLYSQSLIHYWNFNDNTNISTLLAPQSLIPGASIVHIPGGISAIDVAGGTGQNFNVENLNARNGDPSGTHLRFNDPIGGKLLFNLPTNGFTNIIVKFATRRSSSGAGIQYWEYTTDGTNYILYDSIFPVNGNPTLITFDFSSIAAVNDNPNFKLRVSFAQGPGGTVGNNRFDNFTLDGQSSSGDNLPPVATFNPLINSQNIDLDFLPTITFNEDIRFIDNTEINNSNVANIVIFKLDNENGEDVPFSASINNKIISITPTNGLQYSKTYYLAIKPNIIEDLNNNALTDQPFTIFSTLPPQTQFNKGDLLIIAYRMNATATDDEIAILTTVNILPGTRVNFTDAKYTSNAQKQCTGGFTWIAPASGVAAGTVFNIKTDVGTTNLGTITGSTFGLSSSGDQIIVYTGKATNPNYITALSSNAWVSNNTSCSGSLSMLPDGLQDGISSINLSTAPGNTSGNTVNAFYNGPQDLPYSILKSYVLNPLNWIGIGSGTPPQNWPNWSFQGPPVVISAKTLNQNTIEVVFNKDLDPLSSTDLSNYTGINNLQSISRTNNSNLRDTLILTYSQPFEKGVPYSLTIANVKDANLVTMFQPYIFNFTYNTTISFASNFIVLDENIGSYNLILNLTNPSISSVKLILKPAPFSTIDNNDIILSNPITLNFNANSSNTQIVPLTIVDDLLMENDEYFVLYLEEPNGLSISGTPFTTIYIKDNEKKVIVPDTNELKLKYIKSFSPNNIAGSTCEIVTYDPQTKRLFATSSIQSRLDIIDFSNPSNPITIGSIDISTYGGITSVAAKNGVLAVASPNQNEQLDGKALFFDTNGNFLKSVTVGALPDMITFTPDGTKVLTANEGQPNDLYTIDPEGSVSIIDITNGISNLSQSNVTTLYFNQFNANEANIISSGVRKLKKTSTLSQDLEPEYIAVSDDSKKAWVTCQENNAIIEINLINNTINGIWAQGTIDMTNQRNGFDASDNNNHILISNWDVKSFFISDATVHFKNNGTNYLITANEGDEKEYAGLNERTTVGSNSYVLDLIKYPNAQVLKQSYNLGRLRVTNLNGDENGDGKFEQIYTVGTRSFSIWNADTKTLIWDSGNDFEQIIGKHPDFKNIFNADNNLGTPVAKARSRAKGPEPEGVVTASINNQFYAFISLERVGGVMVYNITNPNQPYFVHYNNSRIISNYADAGPEGIIYIPWNESPDGKNYIVVANEISGTITIYQVITKPSVNLINKNVCRNSTIDLGTIVNNNLVTAINGSGDYSYTWTPTTFLVNQSTGNPTRILNNSNATYSLTVKDNQTGMTATGQISINVLNIPNVVLPLLYRHPKNTVLNLNDLISSISGGKSPYNLVWRDKNGIIPDPTNVIPPIGLNAYFLTIIDDNACSSLEKRINIFVAPNREDIEIEFSEDGNLSLISYPNPVIDKLFINIHQNENENARLTIIDITGKIIIDKVIFNYSYYDELDLSTLSKGIYFINIENSQSKISRKIVKN